MGKFQLNKKGEDPLKIYEDVFKIANDTVETHLGKLGKMPNPISSEGHELDDQSSDFQYHKADSSDLLKTNQSIRNPDGSISYPDNFPDVQGRVGRADYKESRASETFTATDEEVLDYLRDNPYQNATEIMHGLGWDGVEDTDVHIMSLYRSGKIETQNGGYVVNESRASEDYGDWNNINTPNLHSGSFNDLLREIGEYDRWATMTENEKIYIYKFSDKIDDGQATVSDYKPYSYESRANEDWEDEESERVQKALDKMNADAYMKQLTKKGYNEESLASEDHPVEDITDVHVHGKNNSVDKVSGVDITVEEADNYKQKDFGNQNEWEDDLDELRGLGGKLPDNNALWNSVEAIASEDYGNMNTVQNPNLVTDGYPMDEEGFARANWDDASIEDRKNWLIVQRQMEPEFAEDEAYTPYFSLDSYTRSQLVKDLHMGGIHAMGTGYL